MKNNLPRKNLNVDKENLLPLWTLKEHDDVVLKLALFKNSVAFDITGQTVRLGAKTSVGLKEQNDGFTIDKNNLDIVLKNSILSQGVVELDLQLIDANGQMTTASFFILVGTKVLNDSAVEATNEFNTFKKTVDQIEGDYKNLKTIMLDENNAANLQVQVNKVNESLEQKANSNIIYDSINIKPLTYQAVVNNPSGIDYNNKPIGIYISFKKGECLNEKRIRVTDKNGNEIPSQWEDDIHARTYKTIGKYPDGSLKNGTIWIISNLLANEEKVFNVTIINTDNNYADKFTLSTSTDGTNQTLTTDLFSVMIHKNTGWSIFGLNYNGNVISNPSVLQTVTIKNNSYADINSSQTGTTNIISKEIVGSGVIFKDIISEFSFIYNENIVCTLFTRVWANGDIDWTSRVETLKELPLGVLNGTMNKIQWNAISGATVDANNNELYSAEIGTSYKVLSGFRWSQRHGESYDSNVYPIVSLSSSAKCYIGWQNTSPTTLVIPKGAYWTSSAYVSLSFDNVANERLRRINRLHTRATNENIRTLKRKFSSLAKFYIENMRDWNLINGENLFPGINGLESLVITNLSGENLYNHAVDRYNNALTFYENGTKQGFVNAWKTTNWRRGIQYIGRDMSILKYLYQDTIKKGDTNLANNVLTVIHNLADAFVEIEGLSGGLGKISLRGDGSLATSTDCMNSEATAIKYINLSLSFKEDATRRACMERIISRFNSTVQYNTRLPYSKIDSVTYKDFLVNPRLHYHAFALFDYLQAIENPPFDIRQLAFEVTNATGQIKEIGYEYQQERRGLGSNATYLACVLFKAGNISDLEQACKLLEYVISFMYPVGGHLFPIDGYSNSDNPIASTPIESQSLIETIIY